MHPSGVDRALKILLSQYLVDVSAVRRVTKESIAAYPDLAAGRAPGEEDCFMLSWGDPPKPHPRLLGYAVTETGFPFDGMHMDGRGLYALSSLNTEEGLAAVAAFKSPTGETPMAILEKSGQPKSKYRQPKREIEWDGIVLALQNPGDRSVLRVGSTEEYWGFLDAACAKYGRHLLLKLHPWNSGEVEKRMREIAAMHGCEIARCGHGCIKKCRFVLTFCSTFAFDCFVRGAPVVQYAPGYFSGTPAVIHTKRELPDDVSPAELQAAAGAGYRMADFILWHYCYNMAMPIEWWVDMLREIAAGAGVAPQKLFPLPSKFSYAANTHWR